MTNELEKALDDSIAWITAAITELESQSNLEATVASLGDIELPDFDIELLKLDISV